LTRIPELFRALQSSVKTDVTLDDVLALAPFGTRLDPAHLRSRFLGRDQVRSYRVPVSGAAVLLPQPEAIRLLLEDAFAPIEASEERELRVDLIPGSDPDTAPLAQERLLYAGFDAALVDGEPSPDGATHVLAHPEAEPQATASLLAALGLPGAALTAWPEAESPAAFRVQLGDDFDACFDPTTAGGPG
jgi:hypothetical protein